MKMTKRLGVTLVVAALLTLGGSVARAHNAGHIHLPHGECQDVGSGKHAPTDNQDKDPDERGDQYGSRHAAAHLETPIYPRHCDEVGAHNHP